MIYETTRKIYDKLKVVPGLKPHMEEHEDMSLVWLEFQHDEDQYRVHFISVSEKNDVRVRIPRLFTVAEDEVARILPVINELNFKYRFTTFYCDEDGDIGVSYDFFQGDPKPEESVQSLLKSIVRIINRSYPVLKEALKESRDAETGDEGSVVPDEIWFNESFGADTGDLDFAALDDIQQELENGGYACENMDMGLIGVNLVSVGMKIDGEDRDIRFILNKGGKLEMRLFHLVKVDDDQREMIATLLETLNMRADGLEFVCDEDGHVNLGYDYPSSVTDAASSVCDLMECVISAVCEALPKIRSALNMDSDPVKIVMGNEQYAAPDVPVFPVHNPDGNAEEESGSNGSWSLREIRDRLEKNGYTCRMKDMIAGHGCHLDVKVRVEDTRSDVVFINRPGQPLKVRMYSLMNLSEDERERVMPVLDELKAEYGDMDVVCDFAGDVSLRYDYPLSFSDIVTDACRLVQRFIDAAAVTITRIKAALTNGDQAPKDTGSTGWTLAQLQAAMEEKGYTCERDMMGIYLTVKVNIDGKVRDVDFFRRGWGNTVVHLFMLVQDVDEKKRALVQPVLDELNKKSGLIEIECDDDGDINLSYEYDDNVNPISNAQELVERFIETAREVFEKVNAKLNGTDGENEIVEGDEEGIAQSGTLEKIERVLMARGFETKLIDLSMQDLMFLTVKLEVDGKCHDMEFIMGCEGRLEVRLFRFLSLTEAADCERVKPMLEFLNLKVDKVYFECDGDGDINICYEHPKDAGDPSETAYELVQCVINAIHEAYPLLKLFGSAD